MESIPPIEMSDAALAVAWASGDERAFEQIVARHAPRIYNRCRLALGAADADDATQSVFLVLAHKGAQAAASPVLAAWLMQVAGNVVRNAVRDRGRRRNAERHIPPPSASGDSTMSDIAVHLDACLADLPAAEREAVSLRHLAGCTLAEVAAHTGSGVSTIHARVQRGLERLRTLLARRGIVIGAVALLACLQAEAQAAVPEAVLVHLRELTPARFGGGTTAPSQRAIRWSRQHRVPMSRIAIAGAALLLTGGLLSHHLAASAAAADAASAPPGTTPAVGSADPRSVPISIDPEHARVYLIARIDDVPAVIARCRQQPEAKLIPPGKVSILDALNGVRRAHLVLDPFSVFPRSTQVQMMRTLADNGLPEARQSRPSASMNTIGTPSLRADLDLVDGSAGEAARSLVRSWCATLQLDAPTWSIVDVPRHFGLEHEAPYGDASGIAAALAVASGGADLNLDLMIDPGVSGAKSETSISIAVTLSQAGAHLVWNGRPLVHPLPAPSPACNRQSLTRVPHQALAAAVYRLSRGSTLARLRAQLSDPIPSDMPKGDHGDFTVNLEPAGFSGALHVLDAKLRATWLALLAVLDRQDGDVLIWMQPGTPFPSICCDVPMSEAEAEGLIASQAMGNVHEFTMMVGELELHGCWRAGRLVVTTDPAGTSAILPPGGFCDNPDVRLALAEMPDRPAPFALIMRSTPCLDQALPLLAMVLSPEQCGMMRAYRDAVGIAKGHGWLVGGMRVDGLSRNEAGGVIALGAVGVIVALAQDPSQLLGVSN